MPTGRNNRPCQAAFVLFILVAAAAAALFITRAVLAISFQIPLQIVTSGFEADSLFSIWKTIHGRAVYTYPYEIPFSASYFNRLFYFTYGGIAGGVLRAFHLTGAWLPTAARMVTLAGGLFAAFVFYRLLTEFYFSGRGAYAVLFSVSVSVFTFFGPLVGFWVLTARPDIWATALEISALYIFVKTYPTAPLKGVWGFSLICFAAWLFKSTNVGVFPGICGYLLFSGRYRCFAIAASVMGFLCMATVASGTGEYRFMMFSIHRIMPYSFFYGLKRVVDFFIKTLPVNAVLCHVIAARAREGIDARRTLFSDRYVRILAFVWPITLLLPLVSVGRWGAESHYFITFNAVNVLLVVRLFDGYRRRRGAAGVCITGIASLLAFGLMIGAVFGGYAGEVSLRGRHEQNINYRRCIAQNPGPVLVDNTYAALPWMNPGAPHFVLADAYYLLKYSEKYKLARGGVEGLLQAGYFGAVILDSKGSYRHRYRPLLERLPGYVRADPPPSCADLIVYHRK